LHVGHRKRSAPSGAAIFFLQLGHVTISLATARSPVR